MGARGVQADRLAPVSVLCSSESKPRWFTRARDNAQLSL
ncbi:Hypothetical protein ETEE_4133 [Edwardsiella anguillarum ET080813]|uniref:Uncharacterized protein n=1 Tax=Edwardsiella anguillarum ET080813 TaxID=667120 RepID=A0A076LYV5_9GAMM|nr:Hypothetical protein ETEE_4133 [Edwardsiella anguillarum ET080813]